MFSAGGRAGLVAGLPGSTQTSLDVSFGTTNIAVLARHVRGYVHTCITAARQPIPLHNTCTAML
jgi:hypothetical protein